MRNEGPLAKWETQDGYIKYRLYSEDDRFVLVKQDLNASVSTTASPVKGFSLGSAVKSVESRIKRSKNQLVRTY